MKPSILVTGAYGGMGKATVKALKVEGYRIFALDKTVGECEENIVTIETDITDEASVKLAFEQIKSTATHYCFCWAFSQKASSFGLSNKY